MVCTQKYNDYTIGKKMPKVPTNEVPTNEVPTNEVPTNESRQPEMSWHEVQQRARREADKRANIAELNEFLELKIDSWSKLQDHAKRETQGEKRKSETQGEKLNES